jgi:hypothetical protein
MLEMESFLRYFRDLYSNNPSLDIKDDTIYYTLTNYGITDSYLNKDISDYFNKWINRFKNKRNIKVFWTDDQKNFLQFHNGFDYQNDSNIKFFKLYVSFPKDKIYKCANKIFDYIDQNNFVSLSKVANKVRSDDVVLRMKYEKDARKVIEFINNDSELSQAANITNPFLVRAGVVGITYDDYLSYNDVLSGIMESYFKKYRQKNTLDKVSLNDFRTYVQNEYNINFKSSDGIYKFSKRATSDDIMTFGSIEKFILNYEQIYQLIIKTLDEKTKLDEIISTVNNFRDYMNDIVMLNYFHRAIDYQKKSSISSEDIHNSNLDNSQKSLKKIVDDYIIYANQKYELESDNELDGGSGLDEVYKHLSSYLNGNIRAITRDKDFRELFSKYLSPTLVLKISGNNIRKYILDTVSNSYGNYSPLKK